MKTQEIIDIEDKYFINTFNRVPIVLDHGEGVKVWDMAMSIWTSWQE